MRNQILAVATAVTLLFGAVEAGASGSSHHNNNDATGIGNVKQSGGININMQGSNDHNTINNSVTSFRNSNTNNITNKTHNTNYNKNTNTNNNVNTNTNNNSNNSNNTNNNNNSSTNNSSATATGGNATAVSGEGGDGGSSDVSVNVGGDEAAASGAAPTFLTTSNDTCMGSSGIGGQGMSFGFSVGTTWTDSNCIMLKNSRELKAQGHNKAAKARLCMDDDNAMAFELAGDPCPRALKSAQNAVAVMNEWKAEQVAMSGPQTLAQQTQTAKLVQSRIETVESNE